MRSQVLALYVPPVSPEQPKGTHRQRAFVVTKGTASRAWRTSAGPSGDVAQLVERLLCKQDVRSSSLLISKTWGHSSVGRALRWQRKGQEFESPCLHKFLPWYTALAEYAGRPRSREGLRKVRAS